VFSYYDEITKSLINLLEVLRKLRGPGGCDWDREQTSKTLIPYLLEETYEVIESIEEENHEGLKEELGDLTLHILFQSEIAREKKIFNFSDSLKEATKKLIARHPHIFNKGTSKQNTQTWEQLKQKEKNRNSLLDGVPKNLPGLLRARRVQEKAANVGFDWEILQPALDKVDEEIKELKEAISTNNHNNIKDELGDTLFSLVNLSRFLKVNPEEAIKSTISKFEQRFMKLENEIEKAGKSISDSTLVEMDAIWNRIKKEE
tara:strand:+ start:1376 stop:2155 length:780 start_codon:yes stop_codon:yes gene_type:complete